MSLSFDPPDQADAAAGPVWFDRAAGWLQTHARGVLLVAIGFQLLLLVSMIVIHASPLYVGQRIWLHVLPPQGYEYSSGEFVPLSYEFSRIPDSGIAGLPSARQGGNASLADDWLEDRTVFVRLEPEADGKHYRAAGVSLERPRGGIYLKGKYARRRYYDNALRFGIEAYRAAPGERQTLLQQRSAGRLSAEVAVAPWGQATLCGVK